MQKQSIITSIMGGIWEIGQHCMPRRKKPSTNPEGVKELPAVDDSWSAHRVLLSAILCQGFIEGESLRSFGKTNLTRLCARHPSLLWDFRKSL